MENRFLRGRMYVTDDPGAVTHAMSCGFQVIALADVNEKDRYPGCVILSSLLPPPNVIAEILNGNVTGGIMAYKSYLASVDREEVVVTLIAALLKPKNLLMYVEYDQNKEFHILETIMGFFAEAFGIVFGVYGDPNQPAITVASAQNDYVISDLLYVNNYITINDYVMMMPVAAVPSPRAVSLILKNSNRMFSSYDEAMRMAMAIINDLRTEISTGKYNPLLFVR